MTFLQFTLLVLAGVGAGLTGSIAGLASLVSYPALLATGLPPVTANVTNTVALVLNGAGSVSASGPELRGQGRRLLRLSAGAVLGGAAGAALLLLTPSDAFERIVPWLIGGAALAILVQRPPRELAAEGAAGHTGGHDRDHWGTLAGTFGISIYGGYFGAAQGVILIALLGIFIDDGLQRLNALKNVLAALVNGIAALLFIAFADVDWAVAGLLAVGAVTGGQVGATLGRRISPGWLRAVIVVVGVAVAVRLLFQ